MRRVGRSEKVNINKESWKVRKLERWGRGGRSEGPAEQVIEWRPKTVKKEDEEMRME